MDQETKAMFQEVLSELKDIKTSMDKRFDKLEGLVESNSQHTTQLLEKVANVHVSLDEIKESVQQIEARQTLTEKRMNVQRDDVAEVRERVGILEQGKH